MKQNFIKFRKESVQLTEVFASANDDNFDVEDIMQGTLVIGTFGEGKYLAMGWLRGMTQNKENGKVVYEVVNAIEDDNTVFIANARRVAPRSVPVFAASYGLTDTPFIGRPFACNGEKAKLDTGDSTYVMGTEFMYRLNPLF